jgi:NAD(P)H-dependent FMN reductase
MKPILVLSGTNRPGSNTRKIAGHVFGFYRQAGVAAELLDLADLPAEIFHPSSYAEKPASFSRFRDAVLGCSGLVVVSPEYNGGLPGVLKYFIDMLPFPESFEGRPVCFVGLAAGMWGALRPVEQLQMIFAYRNAYLYPERVFIPGVGAAWNADGGLKDEKLAERLRAQASGFAAFAAKLAG